jgi:hypothetical protein
MPVYNVSVDKPIHCGQHVDKHISADTATYLSGHDRSYRPLSASTVTCAFGQLYMVSALVVCLVG